MEHNKEHRKEPRHENQQDMERPFWEGAHEAGAPGLDALRVRLRKDFEAVVKHFQKPVVNFLFRFTRNEEAAMDLAQDTFVKAYRALDSYDGKAAFPTWLFAIAANRAKDHLRRSRREKPWNDEMISRAPAAEKDSPFRAASSAEMTGAMEKALAALPDEYREAVVLRHVNDMSMEEMAGTLGVPVATAKTRLFRGRQMMQEFLKKNWGTPE